MSTITFMVYICTILNEEFGRFLRILQHRIKQKKFANVIFVVNMRTICDEKFDSFQTALTHGNHESANKLVSHLSIRINLYLKKTWLNFYIAHFNEN